MTHDGREADRVRSTRKQEAIAEMQRGIGGELRVRIEAPRRVPARLAELVRRIDQDAA